MAVVTVDYDLDIDQVRSRVLASGVALLIAYFFNFLVQLLVKCARKEKAQKKLLQTSQVMFWFGVASIFSIYPPDFFGASSVGFGYITLLFLIILHVLCFSDRKGCGRSLWAIFYVLYHLCVFLWIATIMVVSFMWTDENYEI